MRTEVGGAQRRWRDAVPGALRRDKSAGSCIKKWNGCSCFVAGLAHIRQLGLARTKAKNVKRLAELLLERHGGEVPRSFAALEALPGVGHKTASVVMAQAFDVPAFPVDTHIHRLAQRWGLSSGESVTRTETDLKVLFPREAWNKLHLQIIFYGREFCTARGCNGTVCPLCRELYPNRRRPVLTSKA